MIINCHEQQFPACATAAIASIRCGAMPGFLDTSKLFRINVDQITGVLVFVALYRLDRS
jgi:hypothetical protein